MELAGNSFFISGGGSGLGEAVARLFREAGAKITIADIQAEPGRQIAEEIGALFVQTDVTNEKSVEQALALAAEAHGGIQGVVNCAGIGTAARVLGKHGSHSLDAFARVIQVNLIGSFNVLRLAAKVMAEGPANVQGERGVIINTASAAAYDGQIGQAAYSASKGGIVSMTLPIARELAAFGIRVMSIAPGIFDTPMLGKLPESARESLGRQVPFPARLGNPAEYAALARHIVENEMLNGEVIRLDGALRMGAQ